MVLQSFDPFEFGQDSQVWHRAQVRLADAERGTEEKRLAGEIQIFFVVGVSAYRFSKY